MKFGISNDIQLMNDVKSLNELISKDSRICGAINSTNKDFSSAYSSSNSSKINTNNNYIYNEHFTKNANYSSYLKYALKVRGEYFAAAKSGANKIDNSNIG